MVRDGLFLMTLTAFVVGCSSDPGTIGSSSEVTGKVTYADGKPVKDVRLNFFPNTSSQNPASVELKADGTFSTKLMSGKYTYAFEATKKAPSLKSIPPEYHTNSAEHAIEVEPGKPIEIQIK